MLNKWETEANQKICAFDLDGVLNHYPDTWVEHLNEILGTDFKDLNEAKNTIPYKKYKDLKWAYRESGKKAFLKPRAGAREVLEVLKANGYQILIITSRPFDQHKSLFKQTIDWLQSCGFSYDGLIFSHEKYLEVLRKAPNLRFLVDDHMYYCNSVAHWGYQAFLVDTIYNQGELLPGVHRIKTLEEVLRYDFIFS